MLFGWLKIVRDGRGALARTRFVFYLDIFSLIKSYYLDRRANYVSDYVIDYASLIDWIV